MLELLWSKETLTLDENNSCELNWSKLFVDIREKCSTIWRTSDKSSEEIPYDYRQKTDNMAQLQIIDDKDDYRFFCR